ncbi:ATP-binding protein [Marinospirillum alkaliphilum]|uniref:histidine kinase n=1 Tax=Marinospirillum alkaliphilum DSM 21637 TaxID=1122209 RepID=A0A1K1UI28_9GAMM|nr:sensor histidine kinase [Marinospirillum alkaliphilum]SFX12494.1 two-component system, CitB family, sensor histidine kinase CitS [Marinospirillum alkaliphilum DSM 21637]
MQLSLRSKMMALIGSLLVLMLTLQGSYLNFSKASLLEEQIGLRALSVAKAVASLPELIEAFEREQPSLVIQPLAEGIRLATGAEYVVVGNHQEIRYAHPVPERIGQRMSGDDNEPALLRGESYISVAEGTLGVAIRGKTPVINAEGDIIGVVSVGFLLDEVSSLIRDALYFSWVLLAVSLLTGLAGAVWIAQHVKKLILGLEPQDIAKLVGEKETILQSIHEGLIAVNPQGEITEVNQTAQRILGLDDTSEAVGHRIAELIPESSLPEVLATGQQQLDQLIWIRGTPYIVNRIPFRDAQGQVAGAVSTFRSQQELLELSRALQEANADVSYLRVLAHEFSNRLYTISGLLQLGQTEQALALIHQDKQLAQQQVASVLQHWSDPVISAMLLGKLLRAEQLGVQLEMDADSSLQLPLSARGQDALLKILSNLLDNALDAARQCQGDQPRVRLAVVDLGNLLLLEVEDNGPGIPDAMRRLVFEQGFSTKTGQHQGLGLSLVNSLCRTLNSELYLEDSELGGACFVIRFDKTRICKTEDETPHDE